MPLETISVIIPTYNRPADLGNALAGIYLQTHKPFEAIVIDDSTNGGSEKVVGRMSEAFADDNIPLRYVRNHGDRGTTIARNLGVATSEGSIILFTDDDVVLDTEYLKVISSIYQNHPEVLGVHGSPNPPRATRSPWQRFMSGIDRSFFIPYYWPDKCDVQRSFKVVIPEYSTKLVKCQWLDGCNLSCRREVFDVIKFDEAMTKYAPGEDLDFSYRISKMSPGRLYLSPDARYVHNKSMVGRMPNEDLLAVVIPNMNYWFRKNIDQTLVNRLVFKWSELGLMAVNFISSIRKGFANRGLEELRVALKTEWRVWKGETG